MLAARCSMALIVAILSTFASGDVGAAEGGMVKVEIYRPESDGLMNLVPCAIMIIGDPKGACHEVVRGPNKYIGDDKTTMLLGGDRVTCEITSSNSIQAFTPPALRPIGYASAVNSWEATRLAPRSRPGETASLLLVPKSQGSTYVGGWWLRQTKLMPGRKRDRH